jgi:hypothetical protein
LERLALSVSFDELRARPESLEETSGSSSRSW